MGDRRELARAWSAQSDKFDDADFNRVWNSIKPPYRTSVGAIFRAVGKAKPQASDPLEGFEAEADASGKPAKWPMIDWPDDEDPRPIAWTVRGFFERNAVGVIWGDPGTYKSFAATALGEGGDDVLRLIGGTAPALAWS